MLHGCVEVFVKQQQACVPPALGLTVPCARVTQSSSPSVWSIARRFLDVHSLDHSRGSRTVVLQSTPYPGLGVPSQGAPRYAFLHQKTTEATSLPLGRARGVRYPRALSLGALGSIPACFSTMRSPSAANKHSVGTYFQAVWNPVFHLNFYPLMLACVDGFCLNSLLLQSLPNGDFSHTFVPSSRTCMLSTARRRTRLLFPLICSLCQCCGPWDASSIQGVAISHPCFGAQLPQV